MKAKKVTKMRAPTARDFSYEHAQAEFCCGLEEIGNLGRDDPDDNFILRYVPPHTEKEELPVDWDKKLPRAEAASLRDRFGPATATTIAYYKGGGRPRPDDDQYVANKVLPQIGFVEVGRFTGQTGNRLILWFKSK